jgi:hypothetical protein
MKKILTLVAIITCFTTNAQITKDSLLKVLSKEACEEVNKKDLNTLDKNNAQAEISMLLAPVMMNHLDDIQTVYGGSITDQNTMTKLGMDLSMKLATTCPKFVELSLKMASADGMEDKIKKMNTQSDNAEDVIKGTFLSLNAGDITTISVAEAKGKTTKLYWLEYFDNADKLITNNKKYLNKKVKVSYTEKSVYDFVRKNYKTIKVIASIDLQ